MSTVQEIDAALKQLAPEDLLHIARRADELFREAKGNAIYQDAYGVLSDADLIIAADAAFREYDKEEAGSDEGTTR